VSGFVVPEIHYALLAPMILTFAAACIGVLVEAFAPRGARRPIQLVLTFGALGIALVMVGVAWGAARITGLGAVAIDGPALALQGSILVLAILGAMLFAERRLDPAGDAFAPSASALPGSPEEQEFTRRGWQQTEIWPLFLFSVTGMLLFPAANDLLMMFIALEVLSLPLYLLAGMSRRRRLLSQEAALKYFILGAFSSAFFLYGAALIYASTGSINFSQIRESLGATGDGGLLLAIGIGMALVGLFFKVGAAPFHQWTPDVYQGSPIPVTAFMAAATKVAAFGAILRLLYVGLSGATWDWQPTVGVVAVIAMVVGSVAALTQTDMKRMLAYSSIAHSGFILTGILAASRLGLESTLVYLVIYGFTTIGAFAIVALVRDAGGEASHLSQWAGLGKRSPLVAGTFALFLLALAGIPLTSGFTAKFAVFSAAIEGGQAYAAIVGVLASAVAAFFYIRVIVLMFFSEPQVDGPVVVVPSALTTVAIAIGAGMTILLGVLPQTLLSLISDAGLFVR
jgi:NADH-quinone oxidoreductase subunit N